MNKSTMISVFGFLMVISCSCSSTKAEQVHTHSDMTSKTYYYNGQAYQATQQYGNFIFYSPKSQQSGYPVRSRANVDEHQVTIHRVNAFRMDELNADTIQNIYNSPLAPRCFVGIIKPQHATASSFVSKSQYQDPRTAMRGLGPTAISKDEIKEIYNAILGDPSPNFEQVFRAMFNRVNKHNCRYKLYGKDSYGRNVIYLYKLGFEDRGIVLFYPNDWSKVVKNKREIYAMIYNDPTRLGWDAFFAKVVQVIVKFNPHIKFRYGIENQEEVFLLTFQRTN